MSNKTDQYWIPRKLDAPALFFMWEADIATVWISCFAVAGMWNMYAFGAIMATILGRSYAKLKEEGGRGLFVKILYWYSPSDLWLSKRIKSYEREYLGG